MKGIFAFLLLATIFINCEGHVADTKNLSHARENVRQAEENFKNMARDKGIGKAFYAFADEDAVIKREGDTLIKGKEGIKIYYNNPKFKNASVIWDPDYVSVSNDGSMAYTYGKYVWTVKDSLGNKKDFTGVFHTVWKKQNDGSWKYVWD